MRILRLSNEYTEALNAAVDTIIGGGVLVYPTDTLYGIGCDATNKDAVDKVYEIKKRDRDKPVSVLVGGLSQLIKYFDINGEELNYLTRYLPGPYTFLLKPKVKMYVSNNEKVGVRVPNHIFIRKVALRSGKPIVTTSANISGKEPPTSINDVKDILDKIDLAIDGGETKHTGPSTIVDIEERKIIRQGVGVFEF